jgi:hypothetical protein
MVPQENLDLIRKDARRIQELASALRTAESADEARRIRREMARISKEIEEASLAADEYDKAVRAVG